MQQLWVKICFSKSGKLQKGKKTDIYKNVLPPCAEPAISHDSHHVSLVQWTNQFASRHKGHRFKSPGGVLMWNRDSPVSVVSRHWWPQRDWSSPGLRPQLSLGPSADNVTVPLDLTQLSCPGFTLAAGLPSGFTTTSAAGGEPCGEPAISHDSHHVSLVQWTNLFASRRKGHRFKSPGG